MTSRIIGSSEVMARGVNTRLTSARRRSCSGGSIMMMVSKPATSSGSFFESVESSMPYALEKPCQSRCAVTTSAKRDSA